MPAVLQALEVAALLSALDEREQRIIELRFGLDRGEPRTLEEVGEHFNLTRERIRQIEARAMSKLRHPSSDTGARDLLAV
jgi:RNA polymerase sigma factor (sigma-70 family)